MNIRSFFIWIFLLIIAIGGYFYSDWKQENAKRTKEHKLKLITIFNDPLNIQTLEIIEPELTQHIRIERRETAKNHWEIITPIVCEADGANVTRIIDKLLGTRIIGQFKANTSLSDFGLEFPRLIINFTGYNGLIAKIYLGELTPDKEYIYAVLPDNNKEILLLPASIQSEIFRTLFDLRNKKVLDFIVADIKEIRLQLKTETIILTKEHVEAKTCWLLEGWGEASPKVIDELLYQIHTLEAINIIDKNIDLSRMGLNNPYQIITLNQNNGSILKFLVGNKTETGNERYVQRQDNTNSILIVKTEILDKINQRPREIIERHLLFFEHEYINELTIKYGTKQTNYHKVGSHWEHIDPLEKNKHNENISIFLWKLLDLKWERVFSFIDSKELDNPVIVIILTLKNPNIENKFTQVKKIKLTLDYLPSLNKSYANKKKLITARVEGDYRTFGITPDFIKTIPIITE